LAAAIFAAQELRAAGSNAAVLVLDGAERLGAKIRVSGGGRCNVTHQRVTPDDFNGPRNIVRNILARFDHEAAIAWFDSLGVRLKTEPTGKLFPDDDSAQTVLRALLGRCGQLGVTVHTLARVLSLESGDGLWTLSTTAGTFLAAKVVMATGGQSLPKTGSDGQGWQIVKALGHTVTPTWPALVPLVLDAGFFHTRLSGLSCEVELSTVADGRPVDRRSGSLLWTHFGVSGPVVLDASRHWIAARNSGANTELRANLVGLPFEHMEHELVRAADQRPRSTVLSEVARRLPARLAQAVAAFAGIPSTVTLAQLSRPLRRQLAHALAELPLPVLQDRGWNHAEVTAGGVPLGEINYRTMESRRAAGLHLVGEMLDCDGRIGGFNFQWAWSTGHIGGVAAARGVLAAGKAL